jgi:hypothetical protein
MMKFHGAFIHELYLSWNYYWPEQLQTGLLNSNSNLSLSVSNNSSSTVNVQVRSPLLCRGQIVPMMNRATSFAVRSSEIEMYVQADFCNHVFPGSEPQRPIEARGIVGSTLTRPWRHAWWTHACYACSLSANDKDQGQTANCSARDRERAEWPSVCIAKKRKKKTLRLRMKPLVVKPVC